MLQVQLIWNLCDDEKNGTCTPPSTQYGGRYPSAINFLVIGFGSIQHVMHLDHAVQGAVRLEVIEVRVSDGVGL
jgi:hypothetical protein